MPNLEIFQPKISEDESPEKKEKRHEKIPRLNMDFFSLAFLFDCFSINSSEKVDVDYNKEQFDHLYNRTVVIQQEGKKTNFGTQTRINLLNYLLENLSKLENDGH